jgi:hypothetical protein
VENTVRGHPFKGIREPIELTITLCLAGQRFGQLTYGSKHGCLA